jgi:hypothetical protein
VSRRAAIVGELPDRHQAAERNRLPRRREPVQQGISATGRASRASTLQVTAARSAARGRRCDIAERDTGTSLTCPSDAKRSAGFVCRASAGTCDVLEACDGAAAACPDDAFKPSTRLPHAGGPRDARRAAPGRRSACPADQLLPAATSAAPPPESATSPRSAPAPSRPARRRARWRRRRSAAARPVVVTSRRVATGSSAVCPPDGKLANGTAATTAATARRGTCARVNLHSGQRDRLRRSVGARLRSARRLDGECAATTQLSSIHTQGQYSFAVAGATTSS